MKRITITIEPQIFDKLPKKDRSAYINLVLKQHYQADSADKLFLAIKKQILADQDISDYIYNKAAEAVTPTTNSYF